LDIIGKHGNIFVYGFGLLHAGDHIDLLHGRPSQIILNILLPKGRFVNIERLTVFLPKPKRNKMEIYNDILSAIKLESINGEVKPTRVQSLSNLAYDKLTRYLSELEGRKMISLNPLGMTEKGRDFLQDYNRIKDFLQEMGVKYLVGLGE
jgi:predicted transcriptional regulator